MTDKAPNADTEGVDIVKRRYEEAEEHARPHFARFQRYDALWDGNLPDKFLAIFQQAEYRDLTHYIPPKAFETCRNLARKIFLAMHSVDPNFELGFFGEEHDHPLAAKNRQLLIFQNDPERGDLESVMDEAITEQVRYGHVAMLPEWHKQIDRLAMDDDGKFVDLPVYEGPRFRVYPAYQALPSPQYDSEGRLKWCVLIDIPTMAELEGWQKLYPKKYSGVEHIEVGTFPLAKANKFITQTQISKLDSTKPEDKKLWPVFIQHYLSGDERIVVANEKWEIARYPNPDRTKKIGVLWQPFIRKKDTTFGKGIFEIIEDSLYESFERRWGRLNRIKLGMNPGGFTTEEEAPAVMSTGLSRWQRVPGKIENYKQHPTAQALQQTELAEESLNYEDIKRAIGLEDVFAGFRPEQSGTATRDLAIREEGADALKYTMRPAAKLQREVMATELELNRQFLPKENLPEHYVLAGIHIEPKDILTNWRIRPLGIQAAVGRAVIQKIMALVVDTLSKLPIYVRNRISINWHLLIKNWLRSMEPYIRNVDQVFPDPQLELIPIVKENAFLAQGLPVPVDPRENHERHVFDEEAGHKIWIETLKKRQMMTPEIAAVSEAHIMAHMEQIQEQGASPGSPLDISRSRSKIPEETSNQSKAGAEGNVNQPATLGT